MQVLLGLGKLLTVAFWWVALINLLMPQVLPFNLLINAVAILLLGLHVLEILFFNASLRGRSHRWFDRLQILLTGIFHVMSIRRR
ncbi:DUF1145 domain-containing protein [Pseudomonas fulva]|nr:DUF1145 domain-containing protein [Pseudomonas fulva]MBF8781502.1 DUF1145 domain-containing protein [Pseudomonas fulva]